MSTETKCRIDEVRIADSGALLVVPRPDEAPDFTWIYRAALEVSWDSTWAALSTPAPVTGTYPSRFGFVVGAAKSEYGVILELTEKTLWVNIPDAIREEIKAQSASAA